MTVLTTELKLYSSPHCRQTSTYLYTHNTETAHPVTCREELQRWFLLCTFHLLPIFYNLTLWKGEGEQQVMESPLGLTPDRCNSGAEERYWDNDVTALQTGIWHVFFLSKNKYLIILTQTIIFKPKQTWTTALLHHKTSLLINGDV